MPKIAAPERLTADDCLKQFSPGFHFLVASPEEKSRVLNTIGRMVGQEFAAGASALDRDETDRFVVAVRAQQLNLKQIRHQFEQLLVAREFYEQHHADAEKNVVEAKKKADALLVELSEVQARYDESERVQQNAQNIFERVQLAEKALSTGCEVLEPALRRWTDSQ
jgi:hypothetical protein